MYNSVVTLKEEEAMKKLAKILLSVWLMTLLANMPVWPGSALAENEAEWTVLFYMCGTDLESKYGYATENLTDISKCKGPQLINDGWLEGTIDTSKLDISKLFEQIRGNSVNVLIETGGCKQWHAEALGMDISNSELQRWRYRYSQGNKKPGSFTLEQTLPGNNMGEPDTLSDFIRWSAENYPAKKYALVLWDHGGGSKTGLFIDELYQDGIMRLNELGDALRDGGVHFETVLFDACMMANLETAYAIHDYANWMVASEELVAGKGTAIDAWLQQLILMPKCDGERLGRWICDMTQIKYANQDNESAQQLMTWSVIDLSKIERAAFYFDHLFLGLCLAYQLSPNDLVTFAKSTFHAEHYGSGGENMVDLSGVFYSSSDNTALGREARWQMLEALMDVVAYSVRGSGRAAARGLSFCYATDFSPAELDIYADNCPSPYYLALLDAISPWTAPDWIYEKVKRMPEMDTIDVYKLKANHVVMEDGTPGFYLDAGNDINLGTVRFSLYYKNEATGQIVSLGTAPIYIENVDNSQKIYHIPGLRVWPAIDGELCEIDAVSISFNDDYNTLYNIPIQIDSDIWNLRCGFLYANYSFVVYGLWEGYDSDSTMFNRNVRELAQMAGREYSLLYKIDNSGRDGKTAYVNGTPKTLYRKMAVDIEPLPVGTYYVEYTIYDVFMRPMKMERVELNWDGKRMTIPEGAWQGQETLSVRDYYESGR